MGKKSKFDSRLSENTMFEVLIEYTCSSNAAWNSHSVLRFVAFGQNVFRTAFSTPGYPKTSRRRWNQSDASAS